MIVKDQGGVSQVPIVDSRVVVSLGRRREDVSTFVLEVNSRVTESSRPEQLVAFHLCFHGVETKLHTHSLPEKVMREGWSERLRDKERERGSEAERSYCTSN